MNKIGIKVFNCTSIGESHIKNNKPCQDFSLSFPANGEDSEHDCFVAIVCDGHGSDKYIRSDKGSRFAGEVTLEAIRNFVSAMKENGCMPAPDNGKYMQVPVKPENIDFYLNKKDNKSDEQLEEEKVFWDIYPQIKKQEEAFRKLFVAIKEKWLERLEKDIQENPVTEEEKQFFNPERIEQAYGTTLMAFVFAPDYWFGFHIGDGKCLAFNTEGEWFEPILWDSKCLGNMTTSLCNSNAVDNFRYTYGNKETMPVAVFLGSDGIDDSFVAIEKVAGFYTNVLRMFTYEDFNQSVSKIQEFLPGLSARGSRDDMSMAGILDVEAIKTTLPLIIQKELKAVSLKIEDITAKESETQSVRQQKAEILEGKNKEKEAFLSEIAKLEESIEELDKENSSLDEEMNVIKAAFNKAKSLLDNRNNEKNEILKQKQEIENTVQQIEKQIQAAEGEMKYTEGLLSKYISEKEELTQKSRRLSGELDGISSKEE